MEGFSNLHRHVAKAAAIALLATAALHAPPLDLPGRVDHWVFDMWSRLSAGSPQSDSVLVEVKTPSELDALATLAERSGARLVLTTLDEPPQHDHALLLGPLDVPAGTRLLRRTTWQRGGHFAFEPDPDGVVRTDSEILDSADGEKQPSLAAVAAEQLNRYVPNSPGSSRRLAFIPGRPFETLNLADLAMDSSPLAGKVVLAGPFEPRFRTPVGELNGPELLAQALTSYRDERHIATGAFPTIAAWLLAALTVVALAAQRLRTRMWRSCAALCGVLAITAAGAAAFRWGYWIPLGAPLSWILASAGFSVWWIPGPGKTGRDDDLVVARRAAAAGELKRAWSSYRQVSPTPGLLPELYELASALDAAAHSDEATDLYHRIAQVDSRFREVSRLLVQRAAPRANAVTPGDREQMPDLLGRYQLLEPIGRGATGFVYLGRDPKINRIVALKAFDLAAEFEPTELEVASRSFLQEAEIAGRLSHPNIVTIFDVGESEGLAYIAMEYLKGRHLSQFASAERLLPPEKVLELLSRTAEALDYAHSQNVVHRDIKPANIMYDSTSDSLKITDFGIARLIDVSRTRTGIVLGTPAFMSPEQLEGKNVNGHTDLFALGVSLYQLLTGHLPFRGASMTKLMFVIANEQHEPVTAVRADLPEPLNEIVDRALAKDPAERYRTGAEMATALRDSIPLVA